MNIRKYLRTVLMDEEIINLLPDRKVYFLHARDPNKQLYVEYEVIDEYGSYHSENKEVATRYVVQVDIFSQGSYSKVEDIIKKKMKEAGFIRGMAADMYEQETGLYHKAMRFSIDMESLF